jgi:hypothetical protein
MAHLRSFSKVIAARPALPGRKGLQRIKPPRFACETESDKERIAHASPGVSLGGI